MFVDTLSMFKIVSVYHRIDVSSKIKGLGPILQTP